MGGVDWSMLVPLPVILALAGAGVAVVGWGRIALQRVVSVVTLSLVLVVSIALLIGADRYGPLSMTVGGWPPRMGIVLIVDRLSALMLVISATVTLGVLLYSVGQGTASSDEERADEGAPLPIFHPTMLVLSAGVSNTFITGDLFNLYVGFEILLASSFVLLTLGGSAPRIRAGISYVVVSLLSSVIFLSAIALLYAATGTVNMAELAQRLDAVPEATRLVLQLMLLVGFAVKAAVFPVFGWLPDSYPTAPAPVTAVFAGLLTKVGVYSIMRTQTLLFPDGRLTELLLWAALATMVIGILGAVAQDDIKRMLSFTLVSHIGYMIFGVGVGTAAGISAAIFYVAHHITVQTTLFLVIGLIERCGGSTSLSRLGGLARLAPFLAVLFFVPAMNLAGIPPFSGFLGKVGLIQAGAAQGTWLTSTLIAGSLLTSLLTLYAIARVWSRAFWEAPPADVRAGPVRLPRGMVAPAAALVAVGLSLTVLAGPLYRVTDRAAADMLDRDPYIEASSRGAAP